MERGAFLLFLAIVAIGDSAHISSYELSDHFIDSVNNLQTTWTAGRNFREDADMDRIKRLMGVKKNHKHSLPMKFVGGNVTLPDLFDARVAWTECSSIGTIRDQGDCGSCWAFGAVEAMTDRICIKSKGQLTPVISADDLISCCSSCGDGCDGGDPQGAWVYWVEYGLVTGGPYESNQGCRPYEVFSCDHHTNGTIEPCPHDIAKTPDCVQKCEANYHNTYNNDLHFSNVSYSIAADEAAIRAEIYENGPVEAAFGVYTDFLHYKYGIYQHTAGSYLGGHAVKIIGWGVENDVKYWLVANSWNTDWGDQGFFKILRGSDECGIEDYIQAGTPKY